MGDGTEYDLGPWMSAELEQSKVETLGGKEERNTQKDDVKDTFHQLGRPRKSSVHSYPAPFSSLTSLSWNT